MGVLDEVGGLLGGGICEDGAIPSVHRTIEVDEEALEEEVDAQVELVNVIDRLSMPDAFEIVFRDPDHEVLETAKVEIGAKVRISTTSSTGEAPEPLVWGEVTSIEVEYDVLGSRAVVRGYDVLHRLAAGRKTRTYHNVTYSDIAEELAGEAGLDADVDESAQTYEHVIQANSRTSTSCTRSRARSTTTSPSRRTPCSSRRPSAPRARRDRATTTARTRGSSCGTTTSRSSGRA